MTSSLVPVVYPESCTGCQICELVCSSAHHGDYNPKKSFVKVMKNEDFAIYIPVFHIGCDTCGGSPKCARFCPTNAINFVKPSDASVSRNRISGFPALIVGGTQESANRGHRHVCH